MMSQEQGPFTPADPAAVLEKQMPKKPDPNFVAEFLEQSKAASRARLNIALSGVKRRGGRKKYFGKRTK
jgi:hypothetical protein